MNDLHIADVQDLIGRPYVHGARGPEAFDCWGVCAEVYRRRGVELPDYEVRHLNHAQTLALIMGNVDDHAEWIDEPDDWAFVFDERSGHIGLHWRGSVMHAARGLGVVVCPLRQFVQMHPRSRFARWHA